MDIIELCGEAWNATKKSHQPSYDELTEVYRNLLSQRAAGGLIGQISDGPFASFEAHVYQQVSAPAPEVEPVEPEPEPVEPPVERVVDEPEEKPLELKGHLPADFPAYDKLHEAGINTYGQLAKVEDLTTVDGIGPATAKNIAKRVKADTKALNK